MSASLSEAFGIEDPLPPNVERADAGDNDALVAHGRVIAIVVREPERIAPTCRLLMEKRPTKAYVTVDMGAIRFVNNGADVMAPGITEADPDIQVGDLVWIRDERNGMPLAVGEALVPGSEMPRGKKGKAVKSLHHVGDPYWTLEL